MQRSNSDIVCEPSVAYSIRESSKTTEVCGTYDMQLESSLKPALDTCASNVAVVVSANEAYGVAEAHELTHTEKECVFKVTANTSCNTDSCKDGDWDYTYVRV